MKIVRLLLVALSLFSVLSVAQDHQAFAQPASANGSIGIQGTISAPAPTATPIISLPSGGQSFSDLPITVSGICSTDLLVKLFKNGVFSGSTKCVNGSFTLLVDLFSGSNDLIAKQYDQLDQESPPSAKVTVTYNDRAPDKTATERVTLSSNFAKRGANPREKLSWPIVVSGGTGPYAVTVEWGDGETGLVSIQSPGEFTLDHSYNNPGVFNVIIKAVDVNGRTAYLQLVAIGNGPSSQTSSGSTVVTAGGDNGGTPSANTTQVKTRILWQPAAVMIPFIVSTFWLGKRYAVYRIRKKIEAGERPFSF
jgi:hypothetical protein